MQSHCITKPASERGEFSKIIRIRIGSVGGLIVIKVGNLESFLIISKRGGAYLVRKINAPNNYSTYVPRWNIEIKPNNRGYLNI